MMMTHSIATTAMRSHGTMLTMAGMTAVMAPMSQNQRWPATMTSEPTYQSPMRVRTPATPGPT